MEEIYRESLSAHSFTEKDGKIYFFALNYNSIYEFNLKTESLRYLGTVPGEPANKKNLYAGCLEKNNRLYFAPFTANSIAIYNLTESSIKTIPIVTEGYGTKNKFWRVIEKNEFVYFIPFRFKAIIQLNVETYEIIYIDYWHKKHFPNLQMNEMVVKNGALICGDELILATLIKNKVLSINLNDFTSKCMEVGTAIGGFIDAFYDGKFLWLIENHTSIIWKYDLHNCNSICYQIGKEQGDSCEYPYINIIDCEDKILAVSYQAKRSYFIEKSSGKITVVDIETEGDMGIWNANHYFAKKINQNEILLANSPDHSITIFNFVTQGKENYKMVDEKAGKRKFQGIMGRGIPYVEKNPYDLRLFLEYLVGTERKEVKKLDLSYGEKIHKAVVE